MNLLSFDSIKYGALLALLITSCQADKTTEGIADAPPAEFSLFQLLDANSTGVQFVNEVADRNDMNGLTYRNFYNGGGVAIGDINNDGLSDLYFTANLKGNKLYLNKGDFRFEDITEKAGVAGTKAWSTGVTMADVNADGLLDIYVSNSGDIAGDNKENELFINNGDLTFSEKAAEYGLNNKGFSTQAAFFDYDLDGDLDCYLLNNSFKDPGRIELYRSMRDIPDELGGDKLYKNEDGKFIDISQQAGIYSSAIGFGLGTCIGDVNGDYYPDIYVSNDFWERDYLYINQRDGTYSEELNTRIDFCSISSMGGDIADINNDGYPEIISTDMLAADNYRLKAMTAFDPYHLEDMKYRANYHYQFGQNCLHLNDGQGNFQEIAMLSGVSATDWSWGALFFDFDNNGLKDLFISNGIQRDLMSMDFRDFMADNKMYVKMARDEPIDYPALTAKMPSNPIKNVAFLNKGRLRFSNQTDELGLGQPAFSNGSAYGDLDNDGDLDLVINNVNEPAFIYKNESDRSEHNYLKIRFKGASKNAFGIGATVTVITKKDKQVTQNFNTRGYQSSIEPHLIFGLGKADSVQRLEVIWPDKKQQIFTNLPGNQELVLDYQDASLEAPATMVTPDPLFREVTRQAIKGNTRHQENRYNDFDHEILLLNMLSTESPKIIKGDVNQDGREDFILLGAKGDKDKLFLQDQNGAFYRKAVPAFERTKAFESTCGALMDHDQDGDLDLLLGAGGNEYQDGRDYFTLRYFENKGSGNFSLNNSKTPPIIGNFSCLEPADFDGDGDLDIFAGARLVPGNYGLPPRSFLLRNNDGNWEDITPIDLADIGMITDASWADIDGDSDQDLVVVGDWIPIQIFKNEDGSLVRQSPIANSSGWWNCLEAADLDLDGDIDFVLGNRGLNSKLQASSSKPLTMFVNDFDGNKKTEFIINWYAPLEDQAYPFATKPDLTSQLPNLRKQILKYEEYAKHTYETLFPFDIRQGSISYEVNTLNNSILWNMGTHFALQALPQEAQLAPVYGIAVGDLTEDGLPDIWLGGNLYNLKPQVGRHNASRGLLLTGLGRRLFKPLPAAESGIYVKGEVRGAQILQAGQQQLLLIARNNEEALVFRKR